MLAIEHKLIYMLHNVRHIIFKYIATDMSKSLTIGLMHVFKTFYKQNSTVFKYNSRSLVHCKKVTMSINYKVHVDIKPKIIPYRDIVVILSSMYMHTN